MNSTEQAKSAGEASLHVVPPPKPQSLRERYPFYLSDCSESCDGMFNLRPADNKYGQRDCVEIAISAPQSDKAKSEPLAVTVPIDELKEQLASLMAGNAVVGSEDPQAYCPDHSPNCSSSLHLWKSRHQYWNGEPLVSMKIVSSKPGAESKPVWISIRHKEIEDILVAVAGAKKS